MGKFGKRNSSLLDKARDDTRMIKPDSWSVVKEARWRFVLQNKGRVSAIRELRRFNVCIPYFEIILIIEQGYFLLQDNSVKVL